MIGPAIAGLRMYPGTALLLGATLMATLAATLPTSGLFGVPAEWTGFRPAIQPTRGGDLGLSWLLGVAPPAAVQAEAVAELSRLLLYGCWATLLIGLVTVVTIGLARADQRRPDLLIRRAVGASRRRLLLSALGEALLIAAIPVALGGLLGLAGVRAAVASWPGPWLRGRELR